MRKLPVLKFLGYFAFTAISINSFAQVAKHPTPAIKAASTYIDVSQVPPVIMESYNKEYPLRTLEVWNGYPEFLDESDWYGCNPYIYNCINPKYYVVDFTKDKIPHKVVYTIEGKKIATHKTMTTKTINAVATSIMNTKYKDWTIAKAHEEIFKGDGADNLVVYKIKVTKGNKIHDLFFKADGTLIKDKESN